MWYRTPQNPLLLELVAVERVRRLSGVSGRSSAVKLIALLRSALCAVQAIVRSVARPAARFSGPVASCAARIVGGRMCL